MHALLLILLSLQTYAKEIALTFDDAPIASSSFFTSEERTKTLIRKLRELRVPSVMIFANACQGQSTKATLKQLKQYVDAGHLIGNHTCSHPRLDQVGFKKYSADALKNDQLLAALLPSRKFFRYPFLNEGTNASDRDQMRAWLKKHNYRHGMVSVDNDDYYVSMVMREAARRKKKLPLKKLEQLFVAHIAGAVEFYDELAWKTLKCSPKHVLLLHEQDATVLFLESLVKELRRKGWKIISAEEAFRDPLYSEDPKNTYGNNGIVAQIHLEKTGRKEFYPEFKNLKRELEELMKE